MANISTVLKFDKTLFFIFFAIYIFLANTLSASMFGEISRYLLVFISFLFFIILYKYLINEKYSNQNKVDNVNNENKNIPEYSWAFTPDEKEKTNSTKEILNILTFTFLFTFISPFLYNFLQIGTYKMFIFILPILPLLLFIENKIKKENIDVEILIKASIVFSIINIIGFIFNFNFYSFFVSIYAVIFYLIYILNIINIDIKYLSNDVKKIYEKDFAEILSEIKSFVNKEKIINFYNENNLKIITVFLFTFDMVYAAANFDNFLFGTYSQFSLLIKFILIPFIYLNYEQVKDILKQTNISKININVNLLFVKGIIVTGLSLIVGFLFVGLLFQSEIYIYHTSLPFIIFASYIFIIAIYILYTSLNIDNTLSKKIFYFWLLIQLFLISVTNLNSIETLSFYMIGNFTILALLNYNLVIKKDRWIFTNLL